MDPHPSLGENPSDLRSQIKEESPPIEVNNFPVSPLSDICRNTRVIELMQGAGVTDTTASIVAGATHAISVGKNSPWSSTINQRDVLSHIERSRNRNVSILAESPGLLFQNIMSPPRTVADV